MGLIGIREIKRLTDERLIKVRRIAEGDGVGLNSGNFKFFSDSVKT